jgi:general secretion pathway protein D
MGKDTMPFIGDIPILGRLFTKESTGGATTDVILTMTPHIIRVPNITEDDLAPMWVGTQNNLTFRGLTPRIESRTQTDPFNAFPRNQQQQPPDAAPTNGTQPEAAAPAPTPQGQGGTPSDPFRQPPPQPQQQTPPKPDSLTQSLVPGSSGNFGPRVAIQPATISVDAGQQQVVRVVGLDIDGLATEELRLLYDVASVEVGDVSVGPAVEFDPVYPPAVTVSPEKGEIVLKSSDPTRPLRFISGGEMLYVTLRALNPGDGYLVIDNLVLRAEDGRRVSATISGGRATVAYR